MPGYTPRGFPYPLGTEPSDGAPQIEALARAIDGDVAGVISGAVGRGTVFATPAARDAAIPAPTAGMTCFVTSLQQHQGWLENIGWYPVGGVVPSTWTRFGATALSPGTGRLVGLTPTFSSIRGGLSFDTGTGYFTVPVRGAYLVTNSMRFTLTSTHAQAGIGTDLGIFHYGGLGASVNSSTTSVATGVLDLAAGAQIGIWYTTPGASLVGCEVSITYTGPLA
jgi:hypothetical protein